MQVRMQAYYGSTSGILLLPSKQFSTSLHCGRVFTHVYRNVMGASLVYIAYSRRYNALIGKTQNSNTLIRKLPCVFGFEIIPISKLFYRKTLLS